MDVEQVKELVENFRGRSLAIDGEDESWTIYLDYLSDTKQYLVTYKDRMMDTEEFELADNVKDLAEIVAGILYHNELI